MRSAREYFICALAMTACGAAHADTRENPYDVLGKALVPIVKVFTPDANGNPVPQGLVIDAKLLEASKLPPELQGQAVHIAVVTPDAVLIQAPIAGQMLTVCRDGDTLWATPGSQIQPLLAQAEQKPLSGKKKKKFESEAAAAMGPLTLPIPQKELVFLPVLFQVEDAGDDTINNAPYRVLDVQLMPELAKSMHAENWTARMWVGADYSLAKVTLKGPSWTGTVEIDKISLPPDLPEATFQPQGTDVLKLTAEQFLNLLSQFGQK